MHVCWVTALTCRWKHVFTVTTLAGDHRDQYPWIQHQQFESRLANVRLLASLCARKTLGLADCEWGQIIEEPNYTEISTFDVRKSVHHHTIQINQTTRRKNFISLSLDVYVWLNMFRAPLRPSSGAHNCTRSLWFYRWSVVVAALLVVVLRPTTLQPSRSNGRTRGS